MGRRCGKRSNPPSIPTRGVGRDARGISRRRSPRRCPTGRLRARPLNGQPRGAPESRAPGRRNCQGWTNRCGRLRAPPASSRCPRSPNPCLRPRKETASVTCLSPILPTRAKPHRSRRRYRRHRPTYRMGLAAEPASDASAAIVMPAPFAPFEPGTLAGPTPDLRLGDDALPRADASGEPLDTELADRTRPSVGRSRLGADAGRPRPRHFRAWARRRVGWRRDHRGRRPRRIRPRIRNWRTV